MPDGKKQPVKAGAPGEVILDFSQVRPFEPLDPKARYLVRCTKLDIGKASGGGPKSQIGRAHV